MRKCLKCPHYKHKLACLACEQKADNGHNTLYPEIIKPTVKNVPLENLSDREKAAVILSIIGEMTYYRISQLTKMDHKTIKSLVVRALRKLRRKKNA